MRQFILFGLGVACCLLPAGCSDNAPAQAHKQVMEKVQLARRHLTAARDLLNRPEPDKPTDRPDQAVNVHLDQAGQALKDLPEASAGDMACAYELQARVAQLQASLTLQQAIQNTVRQAELRQTLRGRMDELAGISARERRLKQSRNTKTRGAWTNTLAQLDGQIKKAETEESQLKRRTGELTGKITAMNRQATIARNQALKIERALPEPGLTGKAIENPQAQSQFIQNVLQASSLQLKAKGLKVKSRLASEQLVLLKRRLQQVVSRLTILRDNRKGLARLRDQSVGREKTTRKGQAALKSRQADLLKKLKADEKILDQSMGLFRDQIDKSVEQARKAAKFLARAVKASKQQIDQARETYNQSGLEEPTALLRLQQDNRPLTLMRVSQAGADLAVAVARAEQSAEFRAQAEWIAYRTRALAGMKLSVPSVGPDAATVNTQIKNAVTDGTAACDKAVATLGKSAQSSKGKAWEWIVQQALAVAWRNRFVLDESSETELKANDYLARARALNPRLGI